MEKITRRAAIRALSLSAGGVMLAPMLNRGHFLSSAFAADALTPAPLADLEAAARKEGKVVAYLNDDFKSWQDGFKAKYPGIEVEVFVAPTAELINKLVTESVAGAPTADVIMSPNTQRKTLGDAGLIAPTRLDSETKIGEGFLDPEGFYHPVYVLLIPMLYNTNSTKDFPHDIYELADPKWKDKIAFDRPQNLTIAANFLASRRGEWGDDKWKKWLDGLVANNVFLTADATSAYEAVLRGERPLGIGTLNDVLAQKPGTPVAAGFYDGGVVPFFQNLWAGAKGSGPNAGKLFINYVLSEEGQRLVAADGRSPVLDIDTPVAVSKLLPAGAKVYAASNLNDFFGNVQTYSELYDQLWPG
jgi:ABC-type Fe3+ transport system substrate-binding protein